MVLVSPTSSQGATRVFLSYSRKDTIFASWLAAKLESADIDVLRDIEDTVPGEVWWSRLKSLIAAADSILFILSSASLGSKVCADEISYAATLNKRIFPIIIEDVDWEHVPAVLARIHSTDFKDATKLDAGLKALIGALMTDIDWVREHTRFGVSMHLT